MKDKFRFSLGGDGYSIRLALPDAIAFPDMSSSTPGAESDTGGPAADEMMLVQVQDGAEKLASGPERDQGLPGRSPARVEMNAAGFLAMDYDLAKLDTSDARYNRNDNSLVVSKRLVIDGVESGAASIRIEEGARILIATDAVAKALGSKAQELPTRISGALAKGGGYIPFYELRGAGIAVEYDPVRDRVSMSMPS
jgi:hypothetical protein